MWETIEIREEQELREKAGRGRARGGRLRETKARGNLTKLLFENGKAGWDLLKGIDGEFQPEMRSGAEARVVTRGLTESHEIRGIEEL
jgi:hypothetical protein